MADTGLRLNDGIKTVVVADIASIRVDNSNFGHYGRVANMFEHILSNQNVVVKIAGGPIYKKNICNTEIIELPFDHSLDEMKGNRGKIRFKFQSIFNGLKLFRNKKIDFIICQPYSFMSWMISIILSPKKHKIYLIEYRNELNKKINQYLYRLAKKKVDGVICPNVDVGTTYALPFLCVSDYIYDKIEYPHFEKKCSYDFGVFGIMSSGKDVEQVITYFSGTEYKVLIAGYCGGRYDFFCKLRGKSGNIEIIDKYLTDQEYTEAIRKTKIVILPYKDDYINQSSGVIYDVLFRGKPVLTKMFPNFRFVNEKGVGISYEKTLDEIECREILQKAEKGVFFDNICRFIEDNRKQIDSINKFLGL